MKKNKAFIIEYSAIVTNEIKDSVFFVSAKDLDKAVLKLKATLTKGRGEFISLCIKDVVVSR